MLALLGIRVKCAYSSECQLCTNASYVHTATCICTYTCVPLYLISASAVYICHWIYKTIHNVDRGFSSRGWRGHEFPIYPQSNFIPLESNITSPLPQEVGFICLQPPSVRFCMKHCSLGYWCCPAQNLMLKSEY